MKEIKNIVICGLGAIGSIYAVKIQDYNKDILKILVDEARYDNYKKNPLIFQGKEYDFDYVLPQQGEPADLIIIATKSSGLSDAIKNIKNFIGKDTIILSLLNGITSEQIIAETYGWDNLLLSYFVGHTSSKKNREVTFDGVGDIVFGEKENKVLTERVLAVKDLCEKIGATYQIPEDMDYSRWKKFTVNIGANQTSAVLRAKYKYIIECPKVLKFAENLMKEVGLVASCEGVKNTEQMVKDAIKILDTMIPEGRTSMLQDVDAGRQTEVDIFAKTVVELGKKHSVPTPYNDIVLEIIEAVDEMSAL